MPLFSITSESTHIYIKLFEYFDASFIAFDTQLAIFYSSKWRDEVFAKNDWILLVVVVCVASIIISEHLFGAMGGITRLMQLVKLEYNTYHSF